ncbi:hypothetical protein MAR_026518, partial [Mya arenaria]
MDHGAVSKGIASASCAGLIEWDHVNKIIQEGMDKYNSIPQFWNYIMSKKQDNIGVAPLKKKSNLLSDAEGKAEILIDQFQSLFTKSNETTTPELLNRNSYPNVSHLLITSKG